jgi:hypothetical protein
VITSTILTLLVIPSFYDSIEIARDRAFAKYRRREARWHALPAFLTTLIEAVLTLVGIRMIWRGGARVLRWLRGRAGGGGSSGGGALPSPSGAD